jgi:hypothetical protein
MTPIFILLLVPMLLVRDCCSQSQNITFTFQNVDYSCTANSTFDMTQVEPDETTTEVAVTTTTTRAPIPNVEYVYEDFSSMTREPDNRQQCTADSDCPDVEHCTDNRCSMCGRVTSSCLEENQKGMFACCKGSKCQPLANQQNPMQLWCMRGDNNCRSNKQCPKPYKCVTSLGKCGFCKDYGTKCFYRLDECCDGFCDSSMSMSTVYGYCNKFSSKPCMSWTDCHANLACHNKRCVNCLRDYAFCRANDDCCSNKCTPLEGNSAGQYTCKPVTV